MFHTNYTLILNQQIPLKQSNKSSALQIITRSIAHLSITHLVGLIVLIVPFIVMIVVLLLVLLLLIANTVTPIQSIVWHIGVLMLDVLVLLIHGVVPSAAGQMLLASLMTLHLSLLLFLLE